VTRADVSFRDKEARVAYDPVQVAIEQMIAAVNGAGFRASVKRQAE
jgi:copper chaperone CopZ